MRQRGAVLIVVLGVLVVLALLGTTFATLTGVEREVSRNYLDLVRARLVAQSGLQDAVTRIEEMFPAAGLQDSPLHRSWIFYGDDATETSSQPTVPVERAKNPSFAVETDNDPTYGSPEPRQVTIDGTPCGFSGAMESSAYAANGDQFALKIKDLSGHVYVNDGAAMGPDGSVSQNLQRILNLLGQNVGVTDLGTRLIAPRPLGGYASTAQVVTVLGAADFGKVRDFITIHAWVDPNVANPVPLSRAVYIEDVYTDLYGGVNYRRGGLNRFGLEKSAFNARQSRTKYAVSAENYNWIPNVPLESPYASVYGLDTLNPQYVEIVGRAPVNVNAAPKEVLIALLTDLQGWFVMERRRNNPRFSGDEYFSFTGTTTYSSVGTEGDEIGFLFCTNPITGPGGIQTSGIPAESIADEILACRDRRVSPFNAAVNYASLWFGGPFRNWRQFHAFCDNLATMGVLFDNRDIFRDCNPVGCTTNGYGALTVVSEPQRRFAVRAVADALKANFNPNLHLNELNPDANLYLRVDKTDLIIHSTEFCFLPTGHFEIESVGRVLHPRGPSVNVLAPGTDNDIIAQAKVVAVVKLFEPRRETSQKQFNGGAITLRSAMSASISNNNKSLEVGPEPDNGLAPFENEWGGYVALPTVGGNYSSSGSTKFPNALWKTLTQYPAPTAHEGAAVCVHFGLDFDAHYHKSGAAVRAELGRTVAGPSENVFNYPDANSSTTDEPSSPPYDPTVTSSDGGNASVLGRGYRLCRSYRLQPGVSLTLPVNPVPPSDLRVDGGYVERNCAASYAASWGGAYVFNGYAAGKPQGTVSFWLKPSFFPELSGKERNLFDHHRYHTPCTYGHFVSPFNLWYFPSQYQSLLNMADSGKPTYASVNIQTFQPCSLAFGTREVHNDAAEPQSIDATFGRMTWSLNHIGHADELTRPSLLQAHRWLHVSFAFTVDLGATQGWLYLNGKSDEVRWTWAEGPSAGPDGSMLGWGSNWGDRFLWRHEPSDEDIHFNLGAPSQVALGARTAAGESPYRNNHSSDGTYDEFFVWDTRADTNGILQWGRGRYFKPIGVPAGAAYASTQEGWFTSGGIPFPGTATSRQLAPESGIAPPPGSFGSGTASGTTVTPATGVRRLYGASWTWYGEAVDAAGKPILSDHGSGLAIDPEVMIQVPGGMEEQYSFSSAPPASPVEPKVDLLLQVDNVDVGPVVTNDGFDTPKRGGILIQGMWPVKYRARFRLENATVNSILLATPVLDDVTLFFSVGSDPYLEYWFENETL